MRGFTAIAQRGYIGLGGLLGLGLAAGVSAQAPPLQLNAVYECRPPYSIKVLSCTATNASGVCEVQSFVTGHPFQRGKSSYPQVLGLLPQCHLQSPAEAQADARSAAQPLPGMAGNPAAGAVGAGGFKAGDRVRVLSDGWQEAQVLQVHGTGFVVRMGNGVEVEKFWPNEVRRIGTLTAEDHAAGQYDKGDRVEVLVNGRWMQGEIRGQNLNMYNILVPGVDTGFGDNHVDTTPENIRLSRQPAPAAAAQRAVGQSPKPGFVSCAGHYEGRWELAAGMAGMKVVFRSGTATITEGLGGEMAFDCFTGDSKVVF
jgi:hypothetical protein